MEFRELPVLVVHDTVITDLLASTHRSSYAESAEFVQDYLLVRQALGDGGNKTAITTPQVFAVLRRRFAEILHALPGDAQFDLLTSLMGWIEKDAFTESLEQVDERGSVYILAHQWGLKRAAQVILLVNEDGMKEKIIAYNQRHGRSWVKSWEDVPYAVMTTDDFKLHLRTHDGATFDFISKAIEELKQ